MWEQIIWEWVIWEWEDMGGGGNAYMGRGPLAETFYTNQIDIGVNDEDFQLYKQQDHHVLKMWREQTICFEGKQHNKGSQFTGNEQ